MNRQRLIAALFAALCLLLAGTIVRQNHVALLSPATAQGNGSFGPEGPGDGLRPAKPAERQGAIAAITAQLKAFQKDDYQKAVQYQSANLKRNFPSVGTFRQMIKAGYPQFANYKSAQFGPARADASGRHVLIPITLTGQDGVTARAFYMMIKESKGYHVDGVIGGAPPRLPMRPGASTDV